MPRSMTGYGRSERQSAKGRLVVEIQSVNRKYLEINISQPKELFRYEIELKKMLASFILRGQVGLRVFFAADKMADNLPDLQQLHSLQKAYGELCGALGYSAKSLDLPFLIEESRKMPAMVEFEDKELLIDTVKKAVAELLKMKQEEGEQLTTDILSRIKGIGSHVDLIEKSAPEAALQYREKLKERLSEIFNEGVDERLLREVALLADKLDINEEIIRLRSHMHALLAALQEEGAIGRKLDFILQEAMREINTIGSKSTLLSVLNSVVCIKTELEKIREQVQNIE